MFAKLILHFLLQLNHFIFPVQRNITIYLFKPKEENITNENKIIYKRVIFQIADSHIFIYIDSLLTNIHT